VSSPLLLTWTDDLDYQHPRRARATVPELTTVRVHPRVGSGRVTKAEKNQGVGSTISCTRRVGSPTQRVGSGHQNRENQRVASGRQFRVHDGSGRVQKRVTRGQLCAIHAYISADAE